MSDESLNKFLCETVERKCWHNNLDSACSKCAMPWPTRNPDYLHSGVAYLRLMQAAMKEAWWRTKNDTQDDSFIIYMVQISDSVAGLAEILVTPSRGARALAEYLGYKEE